jgi:hypothetical protein
MQKKTAWAPAQMGKRMGCPGYRPGMGNLRRNGESGIADIGLSLMSATTIFSVHSAISPSYATYKSFFSRTPEERTIARETLFISLGACSLSALGVYLVFGRIIPAIAGEISALGLFALGMYAISTPPAGASTMDQKRQDQLNAQPAPLQPQNA